ncbi:MAG: glycosyltransferase family 4 protein [Saprospirales bacterium]|nr:glycosyltransferase family 4 protein [Saprospirales bacterium]
MNSTLSVLHVSSARTWRGGEQQLAYLLEELRSLGLEQEVLCIKGSPMAAFCQENGFRFIPYQKRISSNPLIGWEIKKWCNQRRFDLIHVHDSHAHTFAYLAALFGNKTPVIVSRRVDFPIGKSGLSQQKYHHPSIKKILCVSEEIRKVLLQHYRFPERAVVVYSGIDLEKFHFTDTGILHREFGLPESQPIIANVAAIAPHKDYFTFVDTAEILISRHVKATFLIIGGDGGEQEQISAYIRSRGLGSHMVLTGYRTDIPKVLPEIDLLLFTSKTEGLGTSLLDAMVVGVPIVATNAGGIPELIEDGKTGLLATVGDAKGLAQKVIQLLDDPLLRNRLVSQAREKALTFSKASTAQHTLAQYRSASGKSGVY